MQAQNYFGQAYNPVYGGPMMQYGVPQNSLLVRAILRALGFDGSQQAAQMQEAVMEQANRPAGSVRQMAPKTEEEQLREVRDNAAAVKSMPKEGMTDSFRARIAQANPQAAVKAAEDAVPRQDAPEAGSEAMFSMRPNVCAEVPDFLKQSAQGAANAQRQDERETQHFGLQR